MNELLSYLSTDDFWNLFPYTERTNTLGFIYHYLWKAFYDGADEFVLKTDHFEWFNGDVFLGRFPDDDGIFAEPSYPAIMHNILERDNFIRTYLIIKRESATVMVVSLKDSPLDYPDTTRTTE